MTAPSAPIIGARQVGGMLRLCWREVDNATDYNVYMDSHTAPTRLEDSVNFSEVLSSGGWFVWYSNYEVGQLFARVTALNALAQESGYSNEVYRVINSDTDTNPMDSPTQALDINRKLL